MRRMMWFLLSVLILTGSSAMAQDFPRGELYGGYAYLRSDGANFNGWEASITENANSWVGVQADFSGHYNTKFNEGAKNELWLHNFLFGPQFAYRKSNQVNVLFHALLGATHYNGKVTVPDLSESRSKVAFAVAVGAGFDVKIKQGLAFRAVQADYILNRSNGNTLNNFRISAGVVYRFAWK
jgi:hypothetical protein